MSVRWFLAVAVAAFLVATDIPHGLMCLLQVNLARSSSRIRNGPPLTVELAFTVGFPTETIRDSFPPE
jgi:hypothetical protein